MFNFFEFLQVSAEFHSKSLVPFIHQPNNLIATEPENFISISEAVRLVFDFKIEQSGFKLRLNTNMFSPFTKGQGVLVLPWCTL